MPTDAQQHDLDHLEDTAQRLVDLIRLEAPPRIICDHVTLILSRALMAYGDMAFARIGHAIRRTKLVANGYCVECERKLDGEPLPERTPYADHCGECRQALEERDKTLGLEDWLGGD